MVTRPLHKHLLVNGNTPNPPQSKRQLKRWLNDLVKVIGMKKVAGPFVKYIHEPGNKGFTAVVMIETSHIALHVWDEPPQPYFRFDLYTCGELHHTTVNNELTSFLQATELEWIVLDRENGFDQYSQSASFRFD